jgi:hypothetical protein
MRLGYLFDAVSIGALHGVDVEVLADSEVRVDVLPHHAAVARYLEEPTEPALVDQRVAVGQALGIRQPGAEEVRDACFLIFPDDRLGRRIDFERARERERVIQPMRPVVEQQDARATLSASRRRLNR